MNKLYIFLALVILYSCKVQEQPVTQDPAYIKQFHTGVRAMLNEQHEEAITAFKVCLQQNPKDAALHYAMFETYLKQEKYTEAVYHTEQAAELDPKKPTLQKRTRFYVWPDG